ncbi:MAG: hypothetical protein PUB98_04435 [Clostridiales bacterium]|nr:hypothetical protein [Clostridiales bacterium]
MIIWDILGIEKTRDTAVIRRAYAAKAAQCNPEDDPEGFLQLRQVYEQAMAYAKGKETAPHRPADRQPILQPDQADSSGSEQKDANSQPESKPGRGGFSLDINAYPAANPFLQHSVIVQFKSLYCSNQRRERSKWNLYFTSPEFLSVWRESAFTAAFRQTTTDCLEEFPPTKEFQIALAVAYRYRAIVYVDHTEFELAEGAGFDGLHDILSIAALGPLVRKLQGNDVSLSAAYVDYTELCAIAPDGAWTDDALTALDNLLDRYSSSRMKEKCSGNSSTERNVLSLRLLSHFFSSNSLPHTVYEVLWNKFDLNSAIMGRAKVLYGHLREICLNKAPKVCRQRENFFELVKAYDTYTASLTHSDPADIRRQVDDFFAREDFRRAVRNRAFLENHSFWCQVSSGQLFLERMVALYEEQPDLPLANRRKEEALDALQSLARNQRLEAELAHLSQLAQTDITEDSCTLSNPLFLRYFLHTAFFRAENRKQMSLSEYLTSEFPCVGEWNQRLAQQEMTRTFSLARSEDFSRNRKDRQPNNSSQTFDFKVLFHQFYVEYRCNGRMVYQPMLPFWGLEEAEDDEFFLLLPIMAAYQEEFEQVKTRLKERLTKLDVPVEILPTLANTLAGEVACLARTKDGVILTRPMFIARENALTLCVCEWYGNGRLITQRRTGDGIQILQEYCRDGLTDPDKAADCAKEILDEIFAQQQTLVLTGELPFSVSSKYDRSDMGTSKTYQPHEIDTRLLRQLLLDFEKKQIYQLVFSIGELVNVSDSEAEESPRQEVKGDVHIVLLWDNTSPARSQYCALLRFDDKMRHWDALISNQDLYLYADSSTIPRIPFRMGALDAYAVHQTPKKAFAALLSVLNSEPEKDSQWAQTVYLNNALHKYYFVKRMVGGFPMNKQDVGQMLRNKYVLSKPPVRFAVDNPDGSMDAQEVTIRNRGSVSDLLPQFEMGKLNRLILTWSFEGMQLIHLILLHEETEGKPRYQAVVIQDGERKSIDYLVGNRQEYMDADTHRKSPNAQFQGRTIPHYLIHYDFYRMRDFLDLFFMSLPDFAPLLRSFGEFASGPQKLIKAGFTAHRDALLR